MSEKHIPALDGVRGLAVLLVVLFHAGGGAQSSNLLVRSFGNAVHIGWTGVTLFFILSGFLITGILWDSRGAEHWYRNFYMRRVVRIFPLYYFTLALILAGGFVLGNPGEVARHLWVFALYLQNVPPFGEIGFALPSPFSLFHFWSLAVEEQFYFIWPFLLLRVRSIRQMKHLCVATFAISLLFRIVVWAHGGVHNVYGDTLFARGGELALGAWIAMVYREPNWPRVSSILAKLGPLFLLGFAFTCMLDGSVHYHHKWIFTLGISLSALFWGSFLIAALRPGVLSTLMRAAWLRWIGGISYGIYVYHALLVNVFDGLARRLVSPSNHNALFGLTFIITVVGTIVVAWLSFHFFESPILRLRKRYQSRPVTV